MKWAIPLIPVIRIFLMIPVYFPPATGITLIGAKVGMAGMRLIMRLSLAVGLSGLSQIGQIILDIPIGQATHTGQ